MADQQPERQPGEIDPAKYRALLESIDTAFIRAELMRDAQGKAVDARYLDLNPAFAALIGIDLRQAVGRSVRSLDPELPESLFRYCQEVVDSGRTARFRDFRLRPDQWFDVELIPLEGDEFFALLTSSTERRQAGDAYRRSDEKYRMLVNSIDVGFAILEVLTDEKDEPVDYRMLELNPHFERLTGLSAEEALSGKTIREVEPDLEPKWWQIYGHVGLTGEPIRFEEGSHALGRWFDVYAFRIEEPDKRRVALLFNDITHQKQAEHEREWLLREVETERQLLSDVFEHAPSYMAILHGPEHVFERANEAYRMLTGQRDLLGRTVREALPEIEGQGFLELLDHVFASGETHVAHNATALLRRTSESGELEERVLDYVFQPIRDSNGEVAGIFVQGTDLTEHKRAEATLRQREAQQRYLIELGDTLRPLGDASEIEREATRLLGERLGASRVAFATLQSDGSAVLGSNYVDSVPDLAGPMEFEDYDARVKQGLREGRSVVANDTLADPTITSEQRSMFERARIHAHISVPVCKQNRLVGVLAVHHAEPRAWTRAEVELVEETAERVWASVQRARAEAYLRESENLFSTLIGTIDEGFVLTETIFSDDGNVEDIHYLDANAAAVEMVGIDLVGMRTSQISPDFEPYWYEIWGEVARTGVPRREELYARPMQSWLNIYVAKLEPLNPDSKTVIAVFQDVTQRRAQEETTERARQEAEEAVRARDEFLSIASHELRNPLANIKVSAQLLQRLRARGEVNNAQTDRLINSLVDSSDRMSALVDDLLDVSRLRSGQLRLDRQPTDLAELVRGTVQELRESIGPVHIKLDLQRTPAANIDSERIRQVLVNLLDNASKYSPDGGVIEVLLTIDGDGICLSVCDRGIGLPEDSLESVFEPFGRAENATQSNIPGMGLGLYICRRIAEAHHGRLWAESEGPGKGTTFRLWIPVEDRE